MLMSIANCMAPRSRVGRTLLPDKTPIDDFVIMIVYVFPPYRVESFAQ